MDEYNSNKERKRLILFDGMIVDILSNKNSNPIVTELFIRGRKLKKTENCLVSYSAVPKKYSTHKKTTQFIFYTQKILHTFYCENSKQVIWKSCV